MLKKTVAVLAGLVVVLLVAAAVSPVGPMLYKAVSTGFILHPGGYLAGLLPAGTDGLPLGRINLPEGFDISIFAEDVKGARSLALGDEGTVFVGTRSAGRVYALVDSDGDGDAERTVVIAEGLESPNGVAFRGGSLYVAEISRVVRYDRIEERLDDPPEPVVVFDDYPDDGHHGWKFTAFGPDGMLYVPVGAPCNICDAGDPYATITRLDTGRKEMEVFARGIRNTVGFDWHPRTGVLWFTENGRDWMGDDIPPDELNRADRKGMHFGYPYCHGEDIPDPEHNGGRDCSEFAPPVVELGPHVAALGMRFYTGTMFPEEYRSSIFIAEHGSWNRTVPIGYRVMRVPVAGESAGEPEVFAGGWLDGGRAWGRPVDVMVMPDGAMLVSDDKAGAVYRIAWTGP